MNPTQIIWPWDTPAWSKIRKIATTPIHSIADMDSAISGLRGGSRPRHFIDLFHLYDTIEPTQAPGTAHFMEFLLPMLQKLIENGPKTLRSSSGACPARPLFVGQKTNILVPRIVAATIIACMWFDLWNYHYIPAELIGDFPECSFTNIIVNKNIPALQCLLVYFEKIHTIINGPNGASAMRRSIIIARHICTTPPRWADGMSSPICNVTIAPIGTAAPDHAKLQVISAHEFIGGDAFRSTLCTEETALLMRPEALVCMFYCGRIDTHDAIVLIGAEKMSILDGYGANVRFCGAVDTALPTEEIGKSSSGIEVLRHALVFIDASPKTSGISQFITNFDRDLNKAYTGMSFRFSNNRETISTGYWTYAFNASHIQLKFIQQVLAASAAGIDILFQPLTQDVADSTTIFVDWMKTQGMTVGELYRRYIDRIGHDCTTGPHSRLTDLDLFALLMD
jgi:poly(ADP-ribose)glycohydrolase PARG